MKKSMQKIRKSYSIQFILFALVFGMSAAWAQPSNKALVPDPVITSKTTPKATDERALSQDPFGSSNAPTKTSGYVAKNEGIQSLFNALSSEARKPFVLSKLAQKKTITGDFDISNPYRFLERISNQIGLAWYDDGQTIYVYDNSELKNSVVLMRFSSLATLNEFLQRTGLYSKRYPIRGEQGTGTFYVAGPPVYVDLVVSAAQYLDDLNKNVDLNKQKIKVIQLQHSFVGDRSYKVRDQEVKIGGIGKVIEAILANEYKELVSISEEPSAKVVVEKELPFFGAGQANAKPASPPEKQVLNQRSQIKVIAYQDTNSLLIKGTAEQVELIEALIKQLDVPKRHIELSLWIIDIQKTALDQLGVQWQASLKVGNSGSVSFNDLPAGQSSTTALNGAQFLAAVTALNTKGLAEVVSRPVILTQDNVPAIFDNNQSFYERLTAERVASLETITYGTLINVLPRFSRSGDEIEMMLDIEDGNQAAPGNGTNSSVTGIPVVNRVKISTVARVPKDRSLLIGGFTLDRYTRDNSKIPLLGDLPLIGSLFRTTSEQVNKAVRLYLIQPKLLEFGSTWDSKKFSEPPMLTPELPLKDSVKQLKDYSGAFDSGH